MEVDIDIDYPCQQRGMAGGLQTRPIIGHSQTGQEQNIPLHLREVNIMGENPLFPNISMRNSQEAGSSPQDMEMDSRHLETWNKDVDLKKSKKVLEPLDSPPVDTIVRPGLLCAKRKSLAVEEQVPKAGHQRAAQIEDVEDFVNNKINVHVKKECQEFAEPQKLLLDPTAFSGDFMPEKNQKVDYLGKGTNGEVVKFTDAITKKVLTKKTIKVTGKFGVGLNTNEVKVPLLCKSPNIAEVLAVGFNGQEANIIMENAGLNLRQCMAETDIRKYLCKKGVMEVVALDTAAGLRHLAEQGYTHCDLKVENVCVDCAPGRQGGVIAKLIDLASSQGPGDPPTTSDISPEYLDIAFNACFSKNTPFTLGPEDDMWALGMIILFVAWEATPMVLHHLGCQDYPQKIPEEKLLSLRRWVSHKIGEMTQIPAKFYQYPGHPILERVLRKVLTLDRAERATARDLHAHLTELLSPEPQKKKMRGAEEVAKPKVETLGVNTQAGERIVGMQDVAGKLLKLKVNTSQPVQDVYPGRSGYETVVVDKKQHRRPAAQPVLMEEDPTPTAIMQGMGGLYLCTNKVSPPSAQGAHMVRQQAQPLLQRLGLTDRAPKPVGLSRQVINRPADVKVNPSSVRERQYSQETVELHAPGDLKQQQDPDQKVMMQLLLDLDRKTQAYQPVAGGGATTNYGHPPHVTASARRVMVTQSQDRGTGQLTICHGQGSAVPRTVSTLAHKTGREAQQGMGVARQQGLFSGQPVTQTQVFRFGKDSGQHTFDLTAIVPQARSGSPVAAKEQANIPDWEMLFGGNC